MCRGRIKNHVLSYLGIPAVCFSGIAAMGQTTNPEQSYDRIELIAPVDGERLDSFLTATLRWRYPIRKESPWGPYFNYPKVALTVSPHEDLSEPVVNVELADNQTCYRLAVAPETTYYWEAIPHDEQGPLPDKAFRARFTTGPPRIDLTADDAVRYQNPREGAHWRHEKPLEFAEREPLSPWYAVKSYAGPGVPRFEDVRGQFPVPVWDGHPEALDAYWYCWKTLMGVWYFPPDSMDHQAVANICGIRSWGPWGSTMVWDTAFILYFARYGHKAYPFITALDNCYARQHENGFICRESDKCNREVYVWFPANPPLFAWAEWKWYEISGDRERLKRVFLPIVKHYEWFMTYQRRQNGLYWTNGAQEADDSPRNGLMYSAVSATSYQALAARCLALIAGMIGRDDLTPFFEQEHRRLGELVNRYFWDEEHGIYNDLAADGRFITELEPGKLCKHAHMFWPLIAGVAPPERVAGMVRELRNPDSFGRRNGVPSLSADSFGYNSETGQYWRGAVWPPTQCMVQEGLEVSGQTDFANELAHRYYNAQLEVFQKEGTIKENLAPDLALGCGVPEFVGWGGLGPIANLIEAVLGIDGDAPNNTITWRLNKIERHGIRNLRFGAVDVDLLCNKRSSADGPCNVTVESSGEFRLVFVTKNGTVTEQVKTGTNTFMIR